MAQDSLDDMQLRSAQIRSARPMLWAALALAVASVLGMLAKSPVLAIVGWFGSWVAGPMALSRLAPALGTSPLLKYPLFLACALPVFNLAAPLYGMVASRGRQAALDTALRQAQARERRRERESPARTSVAASTARAAAAEAGAAAAVPPPPGAAQALPVLRIVSEGVGDGTEMRLQITGLPGGAPVPSGAQLPPVRATAGVFGVGYHVDAGSHWTSVGREDMQAAGLSLERLHQAALGNLAKLVKGQPGLRVIEEPAKARYCGLLLDGDHEACLVLLDALWDHTLKSRTPNGAVVSIPSRDVLAFCDAGSPEGIAQLKQAASRIPANAQGALTPQLLLRRHGRWELFRG